ncbi:MAG: O-antigen ligase family protein [Bacteroidota bacterium]
MKGDALERYTGFALGFHPLLTLLGLPFISYRGASRVRTEMSRDRASLIWWGAMALSGLISVLLAVHKPSAVASYFEPFFFIWLYILGRVAVRKPVRFLQDFLRGVGALALLILAARLFRLDLSLGHLRIIGRFQAGQRGEILYIGDNSLGLMVQAGVVGALGCFLADWQDRKKRTEYILIFVLSSLALIVTGSRGAMLGTLLAILYLACQFRIAAFLGAGAFLGLLLWLAKDRFRSIVDLQHSSNANRLLIWVSSLRIVRDHLFFGVGPGNFGQVISRYREPGITLQRITCAHSNYLRIFVGWGLIGGLLIWGWQVFVLVRSCLRGWHPAHRIAFAILLAYYAHTMVNDLFVAYAGFLLGFLDNPSLPCTRASVGGEQMPEKRGNPIVA